MSFIKLKPSILTSSLWQEAGHTRILFLTMLTMADSSGKVESSVLGLASQSRISLADTEAGLKVLSSPDPYCQNQKFKGRRIKATDEGWIILDPTEFCEMDPAEKHRAYMREYMRNRRENANG